MNVDKKKMADDIEEEKYSKIKEMLAPVTNVIKKIGLAKIILLIIAIGLALWFISLPKPGNLLLKVIEMDGTQGVDAALVSLQWPDGRIIGDVFTSVTDSSGVVSFSNVPTGKEIVIVVEGSGLYSSTRQSLTLSSGESKSKEIELPKNSGTLAIAPTLLSSDVSETCVKEAILTVTNNGENEVEVEFVGSESLKPAISSDSITVYPQTSENLTISIDISKTGKKKGTKLTGDVRIKGYEKKTRLDLQVSEAPKIDVTPVSLSCPAAQGECQKIVTVKNNGLTTLNNLKIEPSSTVASVLQNGDVERYYQRDSIAPGEEAKFGVILTPNAPTIGVITVKADCFARQIDVEAG